MNVHDHLKHLSVDQIKGEQNRLALPFSVACLNLTKDLNVGMIVRTAAVFGVQKVYILGRRKYDKRTAVGAHNYVNIDRYDCMEDGEFNWRIALNYLLKNHTVVSVEQKLNSAAMPVLARTYDIRLFPVKNIYKPCFVFGNEGDGIPEEFMTRSDYITYIPQQGVIRSLNVSNSAAIVIHEVFRKLCFE